MHSVLLNGLRVWLSDNSGRPLSAPGGRACFYKAGTSTPETVYSDIDLTIEKSLGTIVPTDKLGYLPAIWLKTDRLYKVRIEQRTNEDPREWTLLWEVDNVGYLDDDWTNITKDSAFSVNSIAELKNVNPSEHQTVLVKGYFELGDWGSPALFTWDNNCNIDPDDGAFVLPNGRATSIRGRWVQRFNGGIIDVRRFGAIPGIKNNVSVWNQVHNAIHYVQTYSSEERPYTLGFVAPGRYNLQGSIDFAQYYYIETGSPVKHYLNYFIGHNVVFKLVDNTPNAFINLSKNTLCLTEEPLIEGYSNLLVEPNGSIQVNPVWWGNLACSVSDCNVVGTIETANTKIFNHCIITSNHSFNGTVNLIRCNVSESFFADSFDFKANLSCSSCAIAPASEWFNMQNFVYAKISNGEFTFDLCSKDCQLDIPIANFRLTNGGECIVTCSAQGDCSAYISSFRAVNFQCKIKEAAFKNCFSIIFEPNNIRTIENISAENSSIHGTLYGVHTCGLSHCTWLGTIYGVLSYETQMTLYGTEVTKICDCYNIVACNSRIGELETCHLNLEHTFVSKLTQNYRTTEGLWDGTLRHCSIGEYYVGTSTTPALEPGFFWVKTEINKLVLYPWTLPDTYDMDNPYQIKYYVSKDCSISNGQGLTYQPHINVSFGNNDFENITLQFSGTSGGVDSIWTVLKTKEFLTFFNLVDFSHRGNKSMCPAGAVWGLPVQGIVSWVRNEHDTGSERLPGQDRLKILNMGGGVHRLCLKNQDSSSTSDDSDDRVYKNRNGVIIGDLLV